MILVSSVIETNFLSEVGVKRLQLDKVGVRGHPLRPIGTLSSVLNWNYSVADVLLSEPEGIVTLSIWS